jgi:hypothetical protein
MSRQLSDRMAELVRQIARLRPDWNHPERFFENRSEIETEARKIERELRS